MIDTTQHWWPIATSAELAVDKPLARRLHGIPIVLFRDANGAPAALHDRCPHRHAPLSHGTLCHGKLACPYHGWQFDRDGRCTHVPGLDNGASRNSLVPAPSVKLAYGLVWVCTSPNADTIRPTPPSILEGVDSFILSDRVRCTIADAAENLLDGSHTHFVHAGWIRRDAQRQQLKAEVRRIEGGIEARYSDEGLQSGWISRLLEGSRSESYGRFRLPGVAEIEYRCKKGLNLLATAWLSPEDANYLRVHVRVSTRQGLTPAWLKEAVLKRLFRIILQQDASILELAHDNCELFHAKDLAVPYLNSAIDLLGPHIRSLLAGEPLDSEVERVQICRF